MSGLTPSLQYTNTEQLELNHQTTFIHGRDDQTMAHELHAAL